jgi:putative flavoprotein involved in K+ transport
MRLEFIDTLIVGGGQAGLAMSHMLCQRGCPNIVVERHRIAAVPHALGMLVDE